MLADNWYTDPTLNPSSYDAQYAAAANQIAPGIVDLARSIAAAGESLVSSISRARMQISMTDQQRDLLDLQLQRAQNGLPPLNTADYGLTNVIPGLGMSPLMLILLAGGIYLLASRRD